MTRNRLIETVAKGAAISHFQTGKRKFRIGLIGHGAIARALAQCLSDNGAFEDVEVVGTLVREHQRKIDVQLVVPAATITTDLGHFLEANPDLIVECAGHTAVREICPEVLLYGKDVLLISIGALADIEIERRIRDALKNSSASLTVPAGAVGGLDLLASARLGGLGRVTYASRKPPNAWKGTPIASRLNLDALSGPVEFFRGNARTAALAYPQNANIAAAVALAGIGFERTEVTLCADPAAPGNEHTIFAEGEFGRANIVVVGNPLQENPKTSRLAALSLARSVLNRSGRIVI